MQWGSKAPSVHKEHMNNIMSVCNEDLEHLMCIEGTGKGLIAHGNEMIERSRCEWEEMENQEWMRKDGLGVEREEKVWKEKSSQHGTRHLFLKENNQRGKNSYNAIIYNTHTTTRSP